MAKIPGSVHVYILCLGSLMVMELVRVAVGYREEFGKGLGVHPGFVLSPLLSIILKRVLNCWTIRAATCRRPDGHCPVQGGAAIEGGSH